MDQLSLTFSPDDDGTGELSAHLSAGGFAGSGAAWFNVEEVLAFCDKLEAYPLDPNALPSLAGGYWDDSDCLQTTLLSIDVCPLDSSGKLMLSFLGQRDVDYPRKDQRRRIETWVTIGYNDANRLAQTMKTLVSDSSKELTITFEPLG